MRHHETHEPNSFSLDAPPLLELDDPAETAHAIAGFVSWLSFAGVAAGFFGGLWLSA